MINPRDINVRDVTLSYVGFEPTRFHANDPLVFDVSPEAEERFRMPVCTASDFAVGNFPNSTPHGKTFYLMSWVGCSVPIGYVLPNGEKITDCFQGKIKNEEGKDIGEYHFAPDSTPDCRPAVLILNRREPTLRFA